MGVLTSVLSALGIGGVITAGAVMTAFLPTPFFGFCLHPRGAVRMTPLPCWKGRRRRDSCTESTGWEAWAGLPLWKAPQATSPW